MTALDVWLERAGDKILLPEDALVAPSIEQGSAAHAAPTDAFADVFRQHVLSAQVLVQAVLPGMRAAQWGRIVNVISTSVKEPIAAATSSCSSSGIRVTSSPPSGPGASRAHGLLAFARPPPSSAGPSRCPGSRARRSRGP